MWATLGHFDGCVEELVWATLGPLWWMCYGRASVGGRTEVPSSQNLATPQSYGRGTKNSTISAIVSPSPAQPPVLHFLISFLEAPSRFDQPSPMSLDLTKNIVFFLPWRGKSLWFKSLWYRFEMIWRLSCFRGWSCSFFWSGDRSLWTSF